MELSCRRDTVLLQKVLYDGILEQSVETEHLLPDYCPSIFRILRQKTDPHITCLKISGSRLIIEGICRIEILYTAEESFAPGSVTLRQRFERTVELKDLPKDSAVTASVRCDYINCRAVSPRRLDIRGALLIHAAVSAKTEQTVLSGAKGMGICTDTVSLDALKTHLTALQEFTVREPLPLSYGKPPVGSVLSLEASAKCTECRVIANRAIAKGEVNVKLLYLPKDGAAPERMEHAFPVSQVLDVPGLSETCSVRVHFSVSDIDPVVHSTEDPAEPAVSASFSLCAFCEAMENAQITAVRDAYSTRYETHTTVASLSVRRLLCPVKETRTVRCTVLAEGEPFFAVYDASAAFVPGETRITEAKAAVSGTLCVWVLGASESGAPFCRESKTPCELLFDARAFGAAPAFSPDIAVTDVSYRILSENETEVTAEVLITGFFVGEETAAAVDGITADENARFTDDTPAIRLCFAESGERIWDIAKQYRTDPDGIRAENETAEDTLDAPCVLLIPAPLAAQEE